MNAEVEREIRDAFRAGDFRSATERAIRGYGPELVTFLAALTRDEDAAADVFSEVCERVWSSIGRFRGDSSFRTWLYAIARHAHSHHVQAAYRKKRRALSEAPELERIEAEVRTRTMTFLRTETKSAIQRLRESLGPEEQALLILRIDRKLSWIEIADVHMDPAEPRTEDALRRASQHWRRQFQTVKDKLRTMARREGLVG
jgi:RNA polymerase sigma-70 factor (ECF subfamily)